MKKVKRISMFVAIGALLLLLVGGMVMVLWNWLVPSLFNGPEIGFLESLGLLLLSKILFSPWKGRGCHHEHGGKWQKSYYEKLAGMSPEDRERFKARMREKWRCGPQAEKDKLA